MSIMQEFDAKTTVSPAPRRWPLPVQPLRISGAVTHTRELDFALLARFPQQVMLPLPVLAGHELVGVPLRDALALAGMTDRARSLVIEADSGIHALPLDAIDRLGLVYRIGRVPLPYGLGGPFRLLTTAGGKVEDIKYVTRLWVSDRRYSTTPARGVTAVAR
jgi:DMSO/TMAO reductase YedYZ molybdopterin-dependent catalytic subunit